MTLALQLPKFPSARDDYRRKYYEALDLLILPIHGTVFEIQFPGLREFGKTSVNLWKVDVADRLQYLLKYSKGDIAAFDLFPVAHLQNFVTPNRAGIVNFHDILKGVKALQPEQKVESATLSAF